MGGAMKETYRVPRPPEIALNGNLVASKNSEELLSVLGFCASEKQVAQEAQQGETRATDGSGSPFSPSDDGDPVYQTDNPFLPQWEEPDLRLAAI
jgi:hypothetical protein